jgi:aminoglycoside phosphotransferase family enzyme/predicted kinase
MFSDVQPRVITFLSSPSAFGAGSARVDVIETHISVVFLTENRVYKLKRAIKRSILDFSTLDLRKEACKREVHINSQGAPGLYLGVVPVYQLASGALSLRAEENGATIVEWLVEMRRFDEANLFSQMAEDKRLDRKVILDLADSIAVYHNRADVKYDYGGANASEAILKNLLNDELKQFVGSVFKPEIFDAVSDLAWATLKATAALLDQRQKNGCVRRCHGDLHLRNICLWQGKPSLFDAVEFNLDFANIDTAYDLAFLLMDLDEKGYRRLASFVLNHYMVRTADYSALGALPLFMAMRALVRAYVAAETAAQIESEVATGTQHPDLEKMREEARHYMDLAHSYMHPLPPRIVAVGGLSGTGKSHMSRELAPYLGRAPGAIVLRTDVIRKQIYGIDPFGKLDAGGYSADMTKKTYAALHTYARQAIAAGCSVITDAVFAKQAERDALEDLAHDLGVSFQGIWLYVAPEVAKARIKQRTSTISDATTDIYDQQMAYDLGILTWAQIDSGRSREIVVQDGRTVCGI